MCTDCYRKRIHITLVVDLKQSAAVRWNHYQGILALRWVDFMFGKAWKLLVLHHQGCITHINTLKEWIMSVKGSAFYNKIDALRHYVVCLPDTDT